jgi:hypothetical protein
LFIDVIYQEWMVRSPLNGWLFERTYLWNYWSFEEDYVLEIMFPLL